MRCSIFQIILTFIVFIPTLCFGQDKETEDAAISLRRVWKVGDTQAFRKTVVSRMSNAEEDNSPLGKIDTQSKLTSYWTQTVLSVDKKGTATVKIQWTRFVASSNKNDSESDLKLQMDTKEFAKTKEPSAQHQLMNALLKIPFTVKIDKNGRIFALDGLNRGVKEFLKKTKTISKSQAGFLTKRWSNKVVLGDLQSDFFSLPSQPLKPSEKWKMGPLLSTNGSVFNYENWTFQLASLKRLRTGTLAIIKGESRQSRKQVDVQLKTWGTNRYTIDLQSHKFRVVFNAEKGLFQQAHSTRVYSLEAIFNNVTVLNFKCKDTTTIQLRKKGKKLKSGTKK